MGSCDNMCNGPYQGAATMEETKAIWRAADAVCFDVDSTVCMDEGIDELARFCGKGEEVALMTKQAMRGGMKFQDALRMRLNVVKPSTAKIQAFIDTHPPKLTPHIRELVSLLHRRRVQVYLVSGGFSCLVQPAAKLLNIQTENTYCNKLMFFWNGEYAGFDETQPTSHSGGKGEVIQILKNKYNYKRLVMVGDGATDLEACPPADAFIGFGANAVRDSVKKDAKWFVMSFQEMIDELQKPLAEA